MGFKMENTFEIYDVNSQNVEKTGFFCYMSKRKEPGFKQKLEWLEARFNEGMKIKILHENGGRDTGFIEYIPGENAWRAVYAPNFMVIHCLWVVGKGKEKGYGSQLIDACIEDARNQGMAGVAMVTTNRVWLASKDIFLKKGFKEIDQALGVFQLMVLDFNGENKIKFEDIFDENFNKELEKKMNDILSTERELSENKTVAETFEEVRKEEIKEAENVRIRNNRKKSEKTKDN